MLRVRPMPVLEGHTKTVCHILRSIPSLKAGVLRANKKTLGLRPEGWKRERNEAGPRKLKSGATLQLPLIQREDKHRKREENREMREEFFP